MANDEANQDLDQGEEKPSKKKLLIVVGLVMVLLIVGTVVGYFFLYDGATADEQAGEQADAQQQTDQSELEKGPAHYVKLDPVFVVNLPGNPSLLQVGISVRVNADEMIEFIKSNDPMLRHHLLNLLQRMDAKTLQERAAKESLQAEMLNEINRIAKELEGPGEVKALYFTSFVMQ
jgi:flagellar FliL protein